MSAVSHLALEANLRLPESNAAWWAYVFRSARAGVFIAPIFCRWAAGGSPATISRPASEMGAFFRNRH